MNTPRRVRNLRALLARERREKNLYRDFMLEQTLAWREDRIQEKVHAPHCPRAKFCECNASVGHEKGCPHDNPCECEPLTRLGGLLAALGVVVVATLLAW
jgi:hypothetical protein